MLCSAYTLCLIYFSAEIDALQNQVRVLQQESEQLRSHNSQLSQMLANSKEENGQLKSELNKTLRSLMIINCRL